MAVTSALTKVSQSKWGNKVRIVYDVSMTGTYTTGGDVMLIPHFRDITNQIARLEELHVQGTPTDGTVGYPITYVLSSGKVKFWESTAAAGHAEKGAAESVSTTTFRMTVIARY